MRLAPSLYWSDTASGYVVGIKINPRGCIYGVCGREAAAAAGDLVLVLNTAPAIPFYRSR